MSDKVIFGDLHRLLARFNFVRVPVEGKHVLFEHKSSNTLVAFRPHRSTERVDAMTLAAVRKTLVDNGFLERDAFPQALQKAHARRKTKDKGK
jgi:hypothetical protein